MNMKAIAVNLSNVEGLMCAVVVRRLRDHGWPMKKIESIADKAIERFAAALEDRDRLEEVSRNAAMMHIGGSNDTAIQQMAEAVFAICAVAIADDIHGAQYAELN